MRTGGNKEPISQRGGVPKVRGRSPVSNGDRILATNYASNQGVGGACYEPLKSAYELPGNPPAGFLV